jgi:hypothetical protein
MAIRSKIILPLAIFGILAFANHAYSAEYQIQTKADDIKYIKGTKKARVIGNVEIVIYENKKEANTNPDGNAPKERKPAEDDIYLSGSEFIVDTETKTVSTDSPFKIKTKFKKNQDGKDVYKEVEIKGKQFQLDMETKRLVIKSAELQMEADELDQHVYITGEELTIYNKGESISGNNASITTCNHFEKNIPPHLMLVASYLQYIPNEKIVAWNTSVNMMNQKVYWFPVWMIPLDGKNEKPDLDIGRNDIEGTYFNYKNYYNLNDYHDGNIYTRLSEKKLLYVGIDHTWMAKPNSVTYGSLYFIPFNSRYVFETNPYLKNNITPFAEDYEYTLSHKQWLPFLPFGETSIDYERKNFYNFSSLTALRQDTSALTLKSNYNQIFELGKGINLTTAPNFSWSLRNTKQPEALSNDKILRTTSSTDTSNMTVSLNNSLNDNFKLNFNLAYNTTKNFSKFKENNALATNPYAERETLGTNPFTTKNLDLFSNVKDAFYLYKASENYQFQPSYDLNWTLTDGLRLNFKQNYSDDNSFTYTQSESPYGESTLPKDATNNLSKRLQSNFSLTQDLGWGNLSLEANDTNDFLDDKIFIKDASGNIIADDKLTPEQVKTKTESLRKRSGLPVVDLPKLKLSSVTLFKDIFPVNMNADVGRSYNPPAIAKQIERRLKNPALASQALNTSPITYSNIEAKLGSKALDLGFGNKLDFGGTGYEQSFYDTQDAQFFLFGRVNLKNDFLKYIVPSVTYNRTYADEKNNNPLSNNSSGQQNINQLLGDIQIGDKEEFRLNISNASYDFDKKQYNPINIGVTSLFELGALFSTNVSGIYTFHYTKESDLTRNNVNYSSKDAFQTLINNQAETEESFKSKFFNISKEEAKKDLTSLSDLQLKEKYGTDNRMYDVEGKNVIDNTRLTKDNLGNIYWNQNRFSGINFNFQVQTPWQFGDNKYFGKDKDIPWGIGARFTTSIEPFKTDLKDSSTRQFDNFMNKFGNAKLEGKFVIGGDWVWHTHVDFNLELIAPSEDITKRKNQFLPFNPYISIKKDFHDAILSLELANIYNTGADVNEPFFKLNIELTAFPSLTKQLSDNLDKAKGGISGVTN